MDNILRLYSQDITGAALREYFDETDTTLDSVDHISNLVVENLQAQASSFNGDHGSDCLLFIRAILRASPEEGEGIARRSQVLKGSVSWLIQAGEEVAAQSGRGGANTAQLDEVAGKVVNALIDVGHTFDQGSLVQSLNTMTAVVRNQQSPHTHMFALFSRMLVIAASENSVLVPDSSEEISGAEFRDIILDRICTAPWNHKSVLPLTMALADVEMESKQLETAIVKIMKQFKHVDATDLPVLIYNLLLLSSKGHQRLVLKGTMEFFDRLDAGGSMAESLQSNNPKGAARLGFAELSAVESTVIIHFSFAVKQDQELGTQLLKHMKSGKTAYLSSFSLACLMTMARIHRFEDNVMDYLKSSISSAFKDMERMKRESWVTDFEGMSPLPMHEMFCVIIRKIPFGLEQLTPSLVHCGVYIMDSMAPKSPWSTSDKDVSKKTTPKTPSELGCELGATILAETFKSQTSARSEILDHIMSRIVTKSTSTVFFLDLLETIVRDSSEALREHLPRIKESLDYLSFLSLATAVRLMAAVKDVAKLNRPFRDSLILILRKALFSKTLESRQVALSGFLLLLGPSSKPHLSLRSGSSRIAAHQGSESELPAYSMEILGMLRRCLGQQGEVRHSLYIGLMELLEISPNLNPIIFEILHAHFVHFYDQTGTRVSPLKLEECVGNSKTGGEPTFVEPLHFLMSSVVRSLVGLQKLKRRASISNDEIHADERQVDDCRRDLDTILLGLERAGLEDFELDKTSDFNMATNIGARNNMYATLLSGCYESAIEYVVLKQPSHAGSSVAHGKSVASQRRNPSSHHQQTGKMAEGSAEQILQFFGKMRKLHDIVKEKVVMPKGKKIGALGESSVLGLESATRLMELIFAEQKSGERQDEEAMRLRSNDDFVYYLSTVVHVLLVKLHSSTETLKDSEYDYCRRLSVVLVREFIVSERADGPKAIAAGAKGKDKNKSLLMVGIEALTAGLLTIQRFRAIEPSSELPEGLRNQTIVSSFLSATLPQVNGGHREDQQASEVVAWTTSCTIRYDVDSLAAAYIQYLQALLVMFVNETIPLLKEAAGLLSMIHILSKYLSRAQGDGARANSSCDSQALSRASTAVSTEFITEGASNQLDHLIHWLVKLCRDQALDDATLTKALLSMTLQLEQEGANPQSNADILSAYNGSDHINGGEGSSLGFGSVTATSVVSKRPEAATQLRLAADVLLTYGLNHGGPHVPSLRDLPDKIPQGEESDEDMVRLFQLKREIGVEARLAVVTLRTSGAITEVLLHQVDQSLEGLEWALGKLRYCGLVQTGSERSSAKQSTNDDRPPQQEARAHPGIERTGSSSALTSPEAPETSYSSILTHPHVSKKSSSEFETEICWRVEICLWVLVRISQSCINQSSSEHLIRVLQRGYRVLTALTKYYLTPQSTAPLNLFPSSSSISSTFASLGAKSSHGPQRKVGSNVIQLPHGFLRVTQVAGSELSKHLYSFLSYFQMLDVEQTTRAQERGGGGGQRGKKAGNKGKAKEPAEGDGKAPGKAGGGVGVGGVSGSFKSRQKAKILRESKLIPALIYGVEQYERYVIQLAKKSKVNLTQFMRRSTARDFRIQIQRLGDLGLEDRYEEERQQMMQSHQVGDEEDDADVQMMNVDAGAGDINQDEDAAMVLQEVEEDEGEDEETLTRSRKRTKRED